MMSIKTRNLVRTAGRFPLTGPDGRWRGFFLDFHNTGVPSAQGLPEDYGRARGAQQVMADEFNCLSRYRDADESECSELKPLNLSEEQIAQMISFLKTLDSPVNAQPHWLP